MMDWEDETKLVTKAQAGDKVAMETLINAYRPAIKAAVNRAARFIDRDDARGEAHLTFLNMVHNHDSSKARLAARVKNELDWALQEYSAIVRNTFDVPATTRKRFMTAMRRANGDPGEGRVIAETLGMTGSTFDAIYNLTYGVEVLDVEGYSLYSSAVVDLDTKVMVDMALAALEYDERVIVEAFYGITDYNTKTDKEIGYAMGQRTNSITKRRLKALGKMRERIGVFV